MQGTDKGVGGDLGLDNMIEIDPSKAYSGQVRLMSVVWLDDD